MRLDSLLTSILPTPLTVSALLLCLASALVLGILTALVFTRGCRHTASFALTLALLPMSVALVIMMVNGSIGTGLAVAGTFALVRFRSVPGTAREIAAAAAYDVPVHICHVSTATSAALIRDAKARGVKVTAETAPHYLLLTDEALEKHDADYRMNPPLRSEKDRLAMIEAVKDGTIDVIATDHAPHTPAEKADFLHAPNGSIGMETSFAAAYTALVKTGVLTLTELIEKMSVRPAALLGIEIDPQGALEIASRSRGTPRIANRMLRRVRDFADIYHDSVITREAADHALAQLEVDKLGLDAIDRRMLTAIIRNYGGGPVGLETLAATIGEEAVTLEDVYEPYLMQIGFLSRTPRGRCVTQLAYDHLHIANPNAPQEQQLSF